MPTPKTPSAPVGATRRRRHDALEQTWAAMRQASAADNDALCTLMNAVPMEGELHLATDRGPDFFALYKMQRADTEVWVHDGPDGVDAMCAMVRRPGYVTPGADPVPVVYLGDLRTRLTGRRTLAFAEMYKRLFARQCDVHGVAMGYTAILASNTLALRSLTRVRAKRAGQPRYTRLSPYDMVSVHFVTPPRLARALGPRMPRGLHVRRATAADAPQLDAFYDARQRERPFGAPFTGGMAWRVAHWPGFSWDNTWVAEKNGRVVGMASLFDPAPVKRYRVLGYHGGMRRARAGLDMASRLTGAARMPTRGEAFRALYMTNFAVLPGEPGVQRALLEACYTAGFHSGAHFMSFAAFAGETWAPVLRGWVTRRLGFHLYAVTPADAPPPAPSGRRPAFEIALA